MPHEILEPLTASLESLNAAIANAEKTLTRFHAIPADLVNRLSSYRNICDVQKQYVDEISKCLADGNHDEFNRLVNLVNGLSALILEDAATVLQALLGIEEEEDKSLFN